MTLGSLNRAWGYEDTGPSLVMISDVFLTEDNFLFDRIFDSVYEYHSTHIYSAVTHRLRPVYQSPDGCDIWPISTGVGYSRDNIKNYIGGVIREHCYMGAMQQQGYYSLGGAIFRQY